MAEKKIFIVSEEKAFKEETVEYTYFSGFAVSQKQKSIKSLHESIQKMYPEKSILEISTKSDKEEGVRLSAFNLMFYHEDLKEFVHLENVFQAGKVFDNGGPFSDLLKVAPKDAKRDERLRDSGKLVGFKLYDELWPLEPKTMFYDWIYISALKQNYEIAEKLLQYDIFTDIEFNFKKSLNCQARAAAIFVSLSRQGTLEEKTASKEKFITIYDVYDGEQMSLF